MVATTAGATTMAVDSNEREGRKRLERKSVRVIKRERKRETKKRVG